MASNPYVSSQQQTALDWLDRNGIAYEEHPHHWGVRIEGRYYNPGEAMNFVIDNPPKEPQQ